MQKPLNTRQSTSYLLLRRLFTDSKAKILSLVALVLFTGFANQVQAQSSGFFKNFEVFNGQYYYTINDGGSGFPAFPNNGSFPGTYDQGGQLFLDAEANTFQNGGQNVRATQLYYRVYPKNSSSQGAFIMLPLALSEAIASVSNPTSIDKKWQNTGTKPDLLSLTNGAGTYTLELYFKADVDNSPAPAERYDSNFGNNYKADFTVTGNAPTSWSGATDNNWFNSANWSAGVPTPTTDATISATAQRDPRISAGTAYVRTLRIGSSAIPGARQLSLAGGSELQVFGNFQTVTGGFSQEANSTFVLAGTNQTFDGATFINVRIQGGGVKSLTTRMDVKGTLTFVSGILQTQTLDPNNNSVDLIYDPTNIGTDAQIIGETETSYVLGFLRSLNRQIDQNALNSFNNIGVDLTANGASPGVVSVTRLTGFSYRGVGTSQSIKRSFTFSATGNVNNPSFSLRFHYLDAELNGIPENNLLLFRSQNSNVPFRPLTRTSIDVANNTLVRSDIEGLTFDGVSVLSGVFTLGNAADPLPVTLTSFAAVAQGPNALLTWTTAQELNNSGFEVQVSTDGTTFSKLGFVAAASPNSSEARTYQFRDVTAGKQGTRYYRLRQLDVDGKESLFAPQSLTFGGALAASVKGYPNPFASEINLALQTVAAGQATVSVLDGVGRQVRSWQPTLAAGASNLVLSDLASLPHGLYVVQVRYNDGQTQRLKVVKE